MWVTKHNKCVLELVPSVLLLARRSCACGERTCTASLPVSDSWFLRSWKRTPNLRWRCFLKLARLRASDLNQGSSLTRRQRSWNVTFCSSPTSSARRLGGLARAPLNLGPGTDGRFHPWTWLMSGSGQALSATRTRVSLLRRRPAVWLHQPLLCSCSPPPNPDPPTWPIPSNRERQRRRSRLLTFLRQTETRVFHLSNRFTCGVKGGGGGGGCWGGGQVEDGSGDGRKV